MFTNLTVSLFLLYTAVTVLLDGKEVEYLLKGEYRIIPDFSNPLKLFGVPIGIYGRWIPLSKNGSLCNKGPYTRKKF